MTSSECVIVIVTGRKPSLNKSRGSCGSRETGKSFVDMLFFSDIQVGCACALHAVHRCGKLAAAAAQDPILVARMSNGWGHLPPTSLANHALIGLHVMVQRRLGLWRWTTGVSPQCLLVPRWLSSSVPCASQVHRQSGRWVRGNRVPLRSRLKPQRAVIFRGGVQKDALRAGVDTIFRLWHRDGRSSVRHEHRPLLP